MINSRRQAMHVACLEAMRNGYQILVGKLEGKPRHG
jgi:hypothetical protein